MQTSAHRLLENPRVARRLGGGIHHLMVDEYQDTNLAQQSILFRLADAHRNICLVGDEDQLIYAFRGANPHGFEKFLDSFPSVTAFELTSNYRSHRDVVATCNAWINSFDWDGSTPGISTLRTSIRITPQAVDADDDHPGVVWVSGVSPGDEAVQLAGLLLRLKNQNFIVGWHEVAVLLPSVRGKRADLYHDVLMELNISVCRLRSTARRFHGSPLGRGVPERAGESRVRNSVLGRLKVALGRRNTGPHRKLGVRRECSGCVAVDHGFESPKDLCDQPIRLADLTC